MKSFLLLFCLLIVTLSIGCKKDEELTFQNKFTLFEQPNLEGSKAEYNVATMLREDDIRKTAPDGSNDVASSVSFSLAPGIVVYLYEHENGTGKVLRLEDVGSYNLADEGMDNIISAVEFKVE